MSAILDNIKTALNDTRLPNVQRLRITRTKRALMLYDTETNITLVMVHNDNGYTVSAMVNDHTPIHIVRNADAYTAADALRDAPLHNMRLANFTTPLLALAELLMREAQ